MMQVLVLSLMVFGVFGLLILKEIASALEKRAKAEESLAKSQEKLAAAEEKLATSFGIFSEKASQEIELFRQYYAHAVEKQYDAVR